MCTLIILRRPDHEWPLLMAANRDEMLDRPWLSPGRHWPDRPDVVAGLDQLAGGSWLGLNKYGVVAGILNRRSSLGPAPGQRSRGELPLEALDHAEAVEAAKALAHLETASYRSFNLIVADRRRAFWLRSRGEGDGVRGGDGIEVSELPPGFSMFTAYDRNDTDSPRIRAYLPQFEAAPPPDPGTGDWSAWEKLMASRKGEADSGKEGAMYVVTDSGFGTVSTSLIALPAVGRRDIRPVWLHARGRPGEVRLDTVPL